MQLPIGPNSMADVGRLAYFTDDARELTPVLAPRGWQCSAEIGADGGSSITVFPQGTTATGTTKVSGQAEPACQGCVYRLVCPYIPAAKQQLGSGFGDCDTVPQFSGYSYGGDSPTATGATDDVVELSGSAPSYAEGVLLYRWRHNRGGAAALETCQLPLAEATMCGAITDDFQTRNAASY